MYTKRFFMSCLFLFYALCGHVFATSTIDVIRLEDDTINPVTAEYVINAIAQAHDNRSECLIIELDTPGGLLNSTRKIIKAIMGAQVPVVVYVAPGGSRAGSAGVFVTYAAHIAAMAPSTNIGAAHPVQMGQKEDRTNIWDAVKELVKKDARNRDSSSETSDENEQPKVINENDLPDREDPMASKILNDTVAFMKSIAEQRKRNVQWAIDSVIHSSSITEQEALNTGVIDLIALDRQDLIAQLDGRAVRVGEQDKILTTNKASVRVIPMNGRQKLFNILANPNIAYILMILGFYGLLYEVTNPGIGVPGIAGVIFLILAFFSMQTLPTNYAGLALVILGLALFIAEAMVPGFGLLTLGGLVSLILGSMLLFDSAIPIMRVSFSVILPVAAVTAGITIFLIRAVLVAHRRKSLSGREGLIGAVGVAKGELIAGQPGKVFVHGELWNAIADEHIPDNDPVSIEKINGLFLTVKKRT